VRLGFAVKVYATHPELTQFHRQVDECRTELGELGAHLRAGAIRLSTRPRWLPYRSLAGLWPRCGRTTAELPD